MSSNQFRSKPLYKRDVRPQLSRTPFQSFFRIYIEIQQNLKGINSKKYIQRFFYRCEFMERR